MGLDMYLNKKRYFGLNFEHNQNDKETKIIINGEEIPTKDLTHIEYDVLYWRKENHIHKFFVDNCQDGVDDCRDSYVSKKVLQKLLDIATRIQKDKTLAEELLPTQSGFFFGDVEFDEWYYKSIDELVKNLPKLIEDTEYEYYYHSSW